MPRRFVASAGRVSAWLVAAAALAGIAAVAIAWSGGFTLEVAGVPLRARRWERPAALGGLALLLAAAASPRATRRGLEQGWRAAEHASARGVVTLAVCAWTLWAGIAWGTFAVGGSDSYGYAAQARLMAAGRLTDRIVVPSGFTWTGARASLVPLGFRPGSSPEEIAPTYPPGLPLLMAIALLVSERAMFLLVPCLGALAIWIIWRLGAAMGDAMAGAVCALLVAASPTFLFQLVQPMSDVPAAACWLGALLLASRRRPLSAAAAGAVASLAVLIRPNLAPLLLVAPIPLVAGAAITAPRIRPTAELVGAFVTGLLPAVLLLGWIQWVRYGSPFASGYGPLEEAFSTSNILPNLARYPRWLTETHTWFIWTAAAAPFWITRRAGDRVLAWTALGVIAVVWGSYLPYAYFQWNEWFYTRFLLPAIPLMLLFAAAAAVSAVRVLHPALRAPVLLAVLAGLLPAMLAGARARGVFVLAEHEARYPRAAAAVATALPPNAFVLAMQHSGSIRYYAGRPTLRWDMLDPDRLDAAVGALRSDGFSPCLVVDSVEDAGFRDRFAPARQHALEARDLRGIVGDTRIYVFR